jgi:hypothetical protein
MINDDNIATLSLSSRIVVFSLIFDFIGETPSDT